jgi:RNA polymerase sigma factor for flagellar operon FliA
VAPNSELRWAQAGGLPCKLSVQAPVPGFTLKDLLNLRPQSIIRQRLLTEQMPQVRFIARRIHERLPRHVPFEDLVHAGVVGLIDALQKFDRSKQCNSAPTPSSAFAVRFSIACAKWIGAPAICDGSRHVEEAHDKLRLDLGRNPSEPELAKELGVYEWELRVARV